MVHAFLVVEHNMYDTLLRLLFTSNRVIVGVIVGVYKYDLAKIIKENYRVIRRVIYLISHMLQKEKNILNNGFLQIRDVAGMSPITVSLHLSCRSS